MSNIMEVAANAQKKTTRNICELNKIPVGIETVKRKYKEGTPDEYEIDVVVVNGEDYRVPYSVFLQLKELANDRRVMGFKEFRVLRTGTTQKDTKYTVVPLGV